MSDFRTKTKRHPAFIVFLLAGMLVVLLSAATTRADDCPEDISEDGVVDINDLMEILFNWGECPDPPAECPADLEGDGNVGRRDLAILLAAWGDCTRPDPDVIDHSTTQVDNSECQEQGYFHGGQTHHTFDLQVTTTVPNNTWTTSLGHVLITDPRVSCFQHYAQYANGAAPDAYLFGYFPSLEFDSYWCEPTVIGPGEAGAGDGLLDLEAWIEDADELLATWYYAPPYEQVENVPHTIARFTFATSTACDPCLGMVPAGRAGVAPLAGTLTGDTTHRSDGGELFGWEFDLVAGKVAMDDDVDDGKNVLLNPGGGSDDPTLEALVEFTNGSGSDNAWVVITESYDDLYPDADRYYEVLGATLISSTSLDGGQFFMQMTIPFTAADLNGADPLEMDLAYYDAVEERWFLSVRGNTENSPGHSGPVGDRYVVQDTTVPELSLDLGDFGVYWNPDAQVGFVWANVDHSAPFAAGLAMCREADVNYSGEVDIDDVFDILYAWGACDDCPEDVNDDGVVDIDDVFATLYLWGPCP